MEDHRANNSTRDARIARTARAVLAVTVALLVAGAPAAIADVSGHALPQCQVIDNFGLASKGIAGPTFDNFDTPNGNFWCNTSSGAGQLTFGNGLTLSVPAEFSAHDNAEVMTIPRSLTPTAFSVRVDGADVSKAVGSRGWGFWNRDLDSPTSEIAWFMYQHSNDPGSSALGPNGFFVMAQGLGNPVPAIKYLAPSLLAGTHTYTIVLTKTQVTFEVDSNIVAQFTGKAYVPADTFGPLLSSIWVDNWFYTRAFAPIPQTNTAPSTYHVEWFRQGPDSFVEPAAAPTARAAATPPCKAATLRLSKADRTLARAQNSYRHTASPANRKRVTTARSRQRAAARADKRACT